MKRVLTILLSAAVFWPAGLHARDGRKNSPQPKTASRQSAPTAATGKQAGGNADTSSQLNAVLDRLDQTAANFKTTQADFVWNQYEKVVNDTDTQEGKLYFRRQKDGVEMKADISQPAPKLVLFADGKVRVYEPKINQETVYNTGKNKADFESYLVLGFGGGGHSLLKSFDVHYLGKETAQGVETAKLELVPKSARTRNTFSRILLWIDPARGVSVQQQFFDPVGNYRLAKYSNIQLNTRIPGDVFELKTKGNPRIVSPQG